MPPKSGMKIGGYCEKNLYNPYTEIRKLGRVREATNLENNYLHIHQTTPLMLKWRLFPFLYFARASCIIARCVLIFARDGSQWFGTEKKLIMVSCFPPDRPVFSLLSISPPVFLTWGGRIWVNIICQAKHAMTGFYEDSKTHG